MLAGKLDSSNLPPFHVYLTKNISTNFRFTNVTLYDIKSIIKNFDPKTSVGHDGISMKVIKLLDSNILEPLTLNINQSLTTGIFPDDLKIAKVLPIYKKDDDTLFDNYRPISLLPAISKLFERIVYNQLYNYFVLNKLLYYSQHGFRKLHSTETATLEFVDKIIQHLDSGNIPVAIFIDLSKAFDTIDHQILLYKLQYYGVSGTALNWFRSYLSNRSQYVQFEDVSSSKHNLSTGVPQGSILGPLLFIIYVNDICFASEKFKAILYADDTSIESPLCNFNFSPSATEDILSDSINTELNIINNWFTVNKLSLNSKKTKYMIFHFPQLRLNHLPDIKLKIGNSEIEKCSQFNFLGITLDETLSWRPHVTSIGNKISRTIGTLKKLSNMLPMETLLTIYNSLILPSTYYGALAWGFHPDRIFKLQKKAVRVITKSKYNVHTTNLFRALNILKIHDIVKYKSFLFYNRYTHDLVPEYFLNMFEAHYHHHSYYTRFGNQPHNPSPNRVSSNKCIRYYIPTLLSDAPPSITDKIYTHSYEGFSKYVKKYFLQTYEAQCTNPNCYICNNQITSN